MKIRPFTYFLCAVTIMLALLSPVVISSLLYVPPQNTSYEGVLTLWNVTGWRTGGSSCFSFLKKRAAEFESRNASVFIDVVDMTVSEAEEALKKGELPDLISYPLGFEPGLKLCSLPSADLLFNGLPDRTYPFMCGGYCMLVNTDMLDQKGLLIPEGWGVRPDELINIAKNGIVFDSEKGYSPLPAAALYEYPESEGPSFSTSRETQQPEIVSNIDVSGYSDGLKTFCDGGSCVLIASQRQLYEVQQLYDDNKAPTFRAYALSGYTDMVQMIGAVFSEDNKKNDICRSFAAYLLNQPVQKKLEALGVFPVLKELDIYQNNECFYSVYNLLCADNFPANPKDSSMPDLARKSLGGDKNALAELRRIAGYSK